MTKTGPSFPTRASMLLVALVAVSWGLRAPHLDQLFWNLDEGVTFTIAQQIRDGDVLYRDAADHRGPLAPYLKAVLLAVIGDWNFRGAHSVFAAGLGLFAFGLYLLAKRLGDERAGWFAAGMFTVLSFTIQGPLEMFAMHTEWFMEAFSLLGFLVYATTLRNPGFKVGMATGVLFGLAALNKQPGLLDFGVVLVITGLRLITTRHRRRPWWLFLAGGTLGVVLPLLAAGVYFALQGAGADFVWYAWTYNTAIYVPEVSLVDKATALRMPIDLMREFAPLILILAAGGVIGLLWRTWTNVRGSDAAESDFPTFAWLILGWGAAGWLSSGLSGRLFAHYALHIVPGTCLAAGWMAARVWTPRWPSLSNSRFAARMYRGVVLGLILAGLVHPTIKVARGIDSKPDAAGESWREFARLYSAPQDRWFVWGFFPEIYAYAERLPASRFVYCNFLTGLVPWTNIDPETDTRYAVVPGSWEQLKHDLQQRPPAVVVETTDRHYTKYPMLEQPWLRTWLPLHYAEVSTTATREFGQWAYLRTQSTQNPGATDLPPYIEGEASPKVRMADEDWQDPLIRIEGNASEAVDEVSLLVGERIVRTLRLPKGRATQVSFMITATELQTFGTDEVSLLFSEAETHTRTRRVFVTRRLELDRTVFMPEPRMSWGNEVVLPLDPGDAWQVTTRDHVVGWAPIRDVPLQLSFPLRFGMQRITWIWRGETEPVLQLTGPDDVVTDIPITRQAGNVFSALLPLDAAGHITFRCAADPSIWIGDLTAAALGPALYLGDDAIRPIYSEIGVQGGASTQDGIRWSMHAPARSHYPLQPGITGVVMRYGFIDDVFKNPPEHPTTGAEFRIEHVAATGVREVLFRRYMDPFYVEPDRGLQEVELPLTRRDTGELQLVIDEGRFEQRSGDWTFLQDGRLLGPGPDITLPHGGVISPRSGIFGQGEVINVRTPEGGWDAHAPSPLVYDFPPHLASVAVRLAFKPGAYQGRSSPHITDGVELVVERLSPAGHIEELHRSLVDPATHPEHRGMQVITINLPESDPGDRLVIRTTTGPALDLELDWTTWGPFDGTLRSVGAP